MPDWVERARKAAREWLIQKNQVLAAKEAESKAQEEALFNQSQEVVRKVPGFTKVKQLVNRSFGYSDPEVERKLREFGPAALSEDEVLSMPPERMKRIYGETQARNAAREEMIKAYEGEATSRVPADDLPGEGVATSRVNEPAEKPSKYQAAVDKIKAAKKK